MRSIFAPSFVALVAEGDKARDRRSWEAAASAYERALRVEPRSAPIWVQFGHALKESGHLAEAEMAYRESLKIDESNADTHLQLGHVLKLRKDLSAAVEAYVAALKIDPRFEHARHELRILGWSSQDIADVISGSIDSQLASATSPVKAAVRRQPNDVDAYAENFADVRLLVSLGVVASPEIHYSHYGYRQGRDILMSLAKTPPSRVFVLCPSFFKRCGIGEHARYLANSIEASGLETHRIRTTRDLNDYADDTLRDAVLVVNHGPGLFDGYNPELSEGESTIDLLTVLSARFTAHNLRPILFMHSLLDRDNEVMFPRQQMALEYPIPVVTTIDSAARVFNIFRVEHGMQPIEVPLPPDSRQRQRDYPTIGFFGFFQWGGKNFNALFNVTKALKAKLVGSVATGEPEQISQLKSMIADQRIRCDIGTGWVEDAELATRLSEADYHYLPQHDYDHWNNSGTARFVMNFHKPVLLPPHNAFLDLRRFAIFAEDDDLSGLMAHMRDDGVYASACGRAKAYADAHPMLVEMPRLARDLHLIAGETGAANFITPNLTSAYALLGATRTVFAARTALVAPGSALAAEAGEPNTNERQSAIEALRRSQPGKFELTYPVVEDKKYWRAHYELEEFLFPTAFEVFLNAYRAILKREPNFLDATFASRHMQLRIHDSTPVSARQVCDLLAYLISRRHDLEFAEPVQIYHRGQPVTREMLADTALAHELGTRCQIQLERCAGLSRAEEPAWAYAHHYNLASLLLLPPAWFAGAASAAAARAGIAADFSAAAALTSVLARMMETARAVSDVGARVTDVFVIDAPTVSPVDPSRRVYCAAELWAHEGDAFLVNAFRSIVKRDPCALEMFVLDQKFLLGKAEVLEHLSAIGHANACIVDVASFSPDVLDRTIRELHPIVRQFRSPYAGGWDQRNAYLEAKRDYSRFWLHMKHQKDIWWQQSGRDVDTIVGAASSAGK